MTDRIRKPTLEEIDQQNKEVLLCLESKDGSTFSANITTVGAKALVALSHHYPEGSDRHKLVLDELKLRA